MELIYPSVIVELVYLGVLLWWNLFTWECYCGTCLPKIVIVMEIIYLSVIVELVYPRVLLWWNLFIVELT